MLHFPSKNTAAHTAAPAEVARLHQLLGHHVWAFSNCRVDAPGLPVAEVDWLFYNSVKGTFILSEWKRYPVQVGRVRDVGEPWVLRTSKEVPNPIEQVARQLDVVRRVLRRSVVPSYFPSANQDAVNVYQSVYSPQVDAATLQERLRYGIVHPSLDEVAGTVERRAVAAPLVVQDAIEHIALAEALAELFRCSVGSAVRRKLCPAPPVQPVPAPRIAVIHRELAALHLELASLLDVPAPATTPSPTRPPALPFARVGVPGAPVAPEPAQVRPPPGKPGQTQSARTRLEYHVAKHLPTPRKASPATVTVVRDAFLSALADDQLREGGVHVGQFGALVKARLTVGVTPSKLVGAGSLGTWCMAQAKAAGLTAVKDTADPSVIRLEGSAGA